MKIRSRKRIGLLIGSLEGGGAQSMVLRLLKLLIQAGYPVYLFTMDKNFDAQLPGDPHVQIQLRSRIYCLGDGDVRRGTLLKSVSAMGVYFKLESLIRKKKIDIVISFMERANILNLLLLFVKYKIISVRIHIERDLYRKIMLKRWMIKILYPLLLHRGDVINFNSFESADSFKNTFRIDKKKISVIHNFCDMEALRKKSLEKPDWEYELLFEKPVIVSPGRLVRQKGHTHLIRAFSSLCRVNEDAVLLIIGDGPLRAELIDLSTVLGVRDRVFIAGFQKNLMGCIRKSTLFVLSSLAEGFPNVLLEALALGLPVISTDCMSGPREMLAPGTRPDKKTRKIDFAEYGVLTPPFSGRGKKDNEPLSFAEKKLFQAMQILLEDKNMRNKYRSLARGRANMFSEKNIQKKWIDLFEKSATQV